MTENSAQYIWNGRADLMQQSLESLLTAKREGFRRHSHACYRGATAGSGLLLEHHIRIDGLPLNWVVKPTTRRKIPHEMVDMTGGEERG